MKRVLNVPKRGVGDTTVGRLDAWADGHGASRSWRRCATPARPASAPPSQRGVGQFVELIDSLAGLVADGPGAVLQAALERSGYLDELEAEHTVESEGRLENLGELVGSAREFQTVDEFLEQVSLVADTDEIDDDDSKVTLMTLHSAKGLEFPVVFLVGAEEGVFPHIRALTEPEELEEERRLAYVGITRAREKLYLSHAWSRTLFGSTQYNPPSRFLDEIPTELVEHMGEGRRTSGRASYRSDGGRRQGWQPWSRARRPTPDGSASSTPPSTPGSGRRPPPAPSAMGLRVGDDVRHAKFGEGVILADRGRGRQGRGRRALPRRGREAPAARVVAAADACRRQPAATTTIQPPFRWPDRRGSGGGSGRQAGRTASAGLRRAARAAGDRPASAPTTRAAATPAATVVIGTDSTMWRTDV